MSADVSIFLNICCLIFQFNTISFFNVFLIKINTTENGTNMTVKKCHLTLLICCMTGITNQFGMIFAHSIVAIATFALNFIV